jgi:hypothetical protein
MLRHAQALQAQCDCDNDAELWNLILLTTQLCVYKLLVLGQTVEEMSHLSAVTTHKVLAGIPDSIISAQILSDN